MERKEKGKLSTSTLELPFIPVQSVSSLAQLPTIEGNGFDPVLLCLLPLRISARLTPLAQQHEDRPMALGLPLCPLSPVRRELASSPPLFFSPSGIRTAPHHPPSHVSTAPSLACSV